VPESLGQLLLLEELWLGRFKDSNTFAGPLPSSMSNLFRLDILYLNVATLNGPLPNFTRLTSLSDCGFTPSQMCIIPDYVPVNSNCTFHLPVCETEFIHDCVIITDWLPTLFDSYACCQEIGVTCEDDRVVILDLSLARTGRKIFGAIPVSIGELVKLQQLYLQDNSLGGNLPLSMSNISSLQIVNITNNVLYGVLSFYPSFKLIGVESNLDLSLPIDLSTIIESPTETPASLSNDESSGNLPLIVGVTSVGLFILLSVILVVLLLKRREQGKETEIELKLLPKYSSPNKQIRLMRMLASGGFGVVWKARYQRKTVAIKLIRMDKERNLKIVKMVVDESSIMRLMVHERIVKYIMFEIESLGIVLEYLPLGSLYEYIQKSKGGMSWTDRYQMMLDICEGMEFLHSNVYADGKTKKLLFHQDLKSGNILLCMEGNPSVLRGKISDFGLSCKFSFV
jgi:hypothetical protein